MCFSAPKAPKPGAQPAPAAAAGADSLLLGPTANSEDQLRNEGLLGRLALRVGRGRAGAPPGVGGGTPASTTGGVPASSSGAAGGGPSGSDVGSVGSGGISGGGGADRGSVRGSQLQ